MSKSETLKGAGGSDPIAGGGAKDTLTDSGGSDIFVFAQGSDSTIVGSSRDTIADFNQTQSDRLNLSAIDSNLATLAADAFAFVGLGATSGAGTVA